jgi:hypothetical protein
MTPLQIEGMIDRICGMYASHNVNKQGMRQAWTQDEFLLSCSLEKAREVIPLVEEHRKIPSLPEIKQMMHRVVQQGNQLSGVADQNCLICCGSGWDAGVTPDNPDGYTRKEKGIRYRFAKVCPCRK